MKTTKTICACALLLSLWSGHQVAADEWTDRRIADAIEFKLFNDPYAAPNDTDVMVKDGIVTVKGTVSSNRAKRRTAEIAETRRGVRSVVNLIDVQPRPASDDQIGGWIRNAIKWDPVAKRQNVEAAVDGGEVTLRGQARSLGAKQMVTRLVSGVRGVTEVQNHMQIDRTTERSDEEIVAAISKRWRWHTFVDPSELRVEVEDGAAVVRGKIGSPALRRQVVRLAEQVSGVESVDAEGVEVDPAVFDDRQKSLVNLKRPDEEIKEAIRDGLAHDPRVFSFVPEIEVEKAFVTLRGKVGSLATKNAIAQVARNTPGVKMVHNYLKVRSGEASRDDAAITKDVRAALKEDPGTDAYEIDAKVRDGKVTLRGEVDELWERVRAGIVVAGIEGVKTLKNRLEVEDGFIDIFEDDGGSNSSLSPSLPQRIARPEMFMDDGQIEEAVEHELRWDTRFAGASISVEVDNRTVALRGNAPTPSVKNAAVALAYQAGALAVANRIEVIPKNPSQ